MDGRTNTMGFKLTFRNLKLHPNINNYTNKYVIYQKNNNYYINNNE